MPDSSTPTYVLWDIDGTLVYNTASPGNLYHQAIERTVGHELEPLVGHQHGRTDAGIIAEHLRAHALDAGLRDRVSGHLRDLTNERAGSGEHRTAAAGAPGLVRRMAGLGWRNCLLTGNSAHRARVKLDGAGFETPAFDWGDSFFGDREVERTGLTRLAARRLRGSRVVVLGDTPRDGSAAEDAGIPFVAVATGAYDVDALRATNAVAVARDCVQDADVIVGAIAALPALA